MAPPAVAAIASFAGKALIGFAASTLVSKITGNQLLGTLAGGLLGGGLAVNPATGVMSWSAGNITGAFSGGGMQSGLNFAQAVTGGQSLLDLGADAGASAFGMAGDAAGALNLASASAPVSSAVPNNFVAAKVGGSDLLSAAPTSIDSTLAAPAQSGANQAAEAATSGASTNTAIETAKSATETGGKGLFDTLNTFLSENKGSANLVAKMVAGMMDDPVAEATEIHRNKLANLEDYHTKGYQPRVFGSPGGPTLNDRIDARLAQGFEPHYARRIGDNYKSMLDTLRNQQQPEERAA